MPPFRHESHPGSTTVGRAPEVCSRPGLQRGPRRQRAALCGGQCQPVECWDFGCTFSRAAVRVWRVHAAGEPHLSAEREHRRCLPCSVLDGGFEKTVQGEQVSRENKINPSGLSCVCPRQEEMFVFYTCYLFYSFYFKREEGRQREQEGKGETKREREKERKGKSKK